MGQGVGMLRPLATIAALALVALLAACHDEIPVEPDNVVSATAQESDTDSERPSTPGNQRPQEWLSYGVTEQHDTERTTYVRYQVASHGAAWNGVFLSIICGYGRHISIGDLPWLKQEQSILLISLDDQPPLAEEVQLHRYDVYSPDGHSEAASLQLDSAVWYAQLRSAHTMTIELLDSDLEPVTFDLVRFFGTPLQNEIEDCPDSTVLGRTTHERVSVTPSR